MGFFSILKKYSIPDFILVAILIISAYCIEYLSQLPSTTPNLTSFIDQKLKSDLVPYYVSCIFTYCVGVIIIFILWVIERIDISIFRKLSSYLFAISFTSFVVSIIKRLVERPRPDTLAACNANHASVCSLFLADHELYSQFTSFPCRSAAETAACATFLSYYLFDIWASDWMYSALFKLIPIAWAFFMGAIEIATRRANPDDVVAGQMLGAIIAHFAYQNMKQQEENQRLYERMRTNSPKPIPAMYT